MPKKFIGIDFGPQSLRVATATLVKGVPVLASVREQRLETTEERAGAMAEMLDDVAFGDRVAACLNGVGSYFRLLEFPFDEAKKIESALDLEMSSQLPTSDELVCDFLNPRPGNERGFTVPAAAVRRMAVVDFLATFQQAGQTLHLLDLNPFAYAAGLADAVPEGVLAVVLTSEITVALVKAGQVISFRTMPRPPHDDAERLADLIRRDYLALTKGSNKNNLPLFLIGGGVTDELGRALTVLGLEPRQPELEFDGQPIAPALIPAAALALRAALPPRTRQFNFLKGDLAPKSEWAGFRLRLIAVAALAGLTLILGASGAYLNYVQQKNQAEMLRQETLAIFKETFPQVHTIVDVPSQMRSNLDQLRERAKMLGLSQNRSALNVLREISARIPKEVRFDVREMVFSEDEVHIDGTTSSFEAANRLSQAFDASPLFEKSQITDAKMGMDGGKVDFRLNLKISSEVLSQ
ncbi:MAG: GspL/Epsl periplasmic domain-containing protein [Deltaproteobacteria bacterium]